MDNYFLLIFLVCDQVRFFPAIDYVTNTVFWADAKLDYIAMADLNLQHRRRIMQNNHERPEHLRHVFAMTVFEDYLFWTDWETKQIHKANKFSGMELAHVQEAASHRPMDIQVFHPYRQTPRKFRITKFLFPKSK